MSERVQQLAAQYRALTSEERDEFLDAVWDDLGDDVKDALFAADPTHDPAFRAEIERRSTAAHEHPELLIPADVAFRQIRERLATDAAARHL